MNKPNNKPNNKPMAEILPGIFLREDGIIKSKRGNYNIRHCVPGGRNCIQNFLSDVQEVILLGNPELKYRTQVGWNKNGITGVCLYIPCDTGCGDEGWTPEPTFISIIKNKTELYHFEGHHSDQFRDDTEDWYAREFMAALNSLLKDIPDFEFLVWLMKCLDFEAFYCSPDGTIDFGASWSQGRGFPSYSSSVTFKKTDKGFKAIRVRQID